MNRKRLVLTIAIVMSGFVSIAEHEVYSKEYFCVGRFVVHERYDRHFRVSTTEHVSQYHRRVIDGIMEIINQEKQERYGL